MALTPEQIKEARAKYGIPEGGYAAQEKPSIKEELAAAWGRTAKIEQARSAAQSAEADAEEAASFGGMMKGALEPTTSFARASLEQIPKGMQQLFSEPEVSNFKQVSSEIGVPAAVVNSVAEVLKSGVRGVAGLGKIVGGAIGAAASPILGPVSKMISDSLPPETKQKFSLFLEEHPEAAKSIEETADISALAIGPVFARGAVRAVSEAPEAALNVARDVKTGISAATEAISPAGIKQVVQDARFSISDLDPQVSTVLSRSSFDDVNRVFQTARNAVKDPAKYSPFEKAGQLAEDAFDAIKKNTFDAANGKKAILEKMADTRISGNTINDVYRSGVEQFADKFGASIGSKGTISQLKGRQLVLDAADQKLVNDYFSRLSSLGVAPSLKQVDDFVDWAQGQLYKQSKSLSKLDAAGDKVISSLRQITGDLNTRLKSAVGGGYGEVNARIAKLLELQDELSRALGADARKGAGVMKRLFSPTAGNTRDLFKQILDETGIDLVKESTLAKFAMETVGDVRQRSLLQTLDIAAKGATEIDLTKPASIYRWLRERADLDGQELANEFLRKINASKPQ